VPTTPVVAESDTLRKAAWALLESPCGAVIVSGPLGTVGVITDRDVVLAVALGLDLDRIRAADAMQATPRRVGSKDEPAEVGRIMVELGLRHVAVVEDDGDVHLVSAHEVLHGVLRRDGDARLSSDRAVSGSEGG